MKFNPNQTNSFSNQHSSICREKNWGTSCDGIAGQAASTKTKESTRIIQDSDKSQSNLNMLQRAFGSQIDLTGVSPPEVTITRRSVECQTEDHPHLGFDPSLLGHQLADNNDSSNTSSPSHLWTITEQKAASDPEDMTIIINLGHKKNKKADSDATDATHVHLE